MTTQLSHDTGKEREKNVSEKENNKQRKKKAPNTARCDVVSIPTLHSASTLFECWSGYFIS